MISAKIDKALEISAECVSAAGEDDIGEKAVDLLDGEYFAIERLKSLFAIVQSGL